ncbi:hypothetical protein [Streptomyces sp. NPDC001970]
MSGANCRSGWRAQYTPAAVAFVAVRNPGEPLQIAWCGDSHAYHQDASRAATRRVTTEHHMRQVLLDAGREPGPYSGGSLRQRRAA